MVQWRYFPSGCPWKNVPFEKADFLEWWKLTFNIIMVQEHSITQKIRFHLWERNNRLLFILIWSFHSRKLPFSEYFIWQSPQIRHILVQMGQRLDTCGCFHVADDKNYSKKTEFLVWRLVASNALEEYCVQNSTKVSDHFIGFWC